ncbi:MAG: zinc-binding alcohol dehydrogenase [Planctomycetota bacterium]
MNDGNAHEPGAISRAYWTVADGRGELRSGATGEFEEGCVLIRALYSCLSRGTESLVHRGRIPQSERARMRAPFQIGDFPHPVKYGYMSVGVVEDGPGDLVGAVVHCLHPHQDLYVVPAEAVVRVPSGVPPRRAACAANVETAVNVLWDARPSLGDRIAVVGAGAVGCIAARLAATTAGARVTLLDTNPSRARIAELLGVDFECVGSDGGTELAEGHADLVLHASGTSAGLALALTLAGDETTVVEASWHGDRNVEVPLGGPFHARRLRIVSSQVGTIPPHRARRWSYARRMALALELLRDDAFDALITGEHSFDEIETALPRAIDDPDTVCAVFRYPGPHPR